MLNTAYHYPRNYSPVNSKKVNRLWIKEPFPAIVRGQNARGEEFEEQVILENLSGRSVTLKLSQSLAVGSKLFVAIRLSTAPLAEPALGIAVRGVVACTAPRMDQNWNAVIAIANYRFLYTKTS
jgi:hypothetical protein